MIRTRCPHCNKLLGIVDSAAGKVTTCPGCKQKFRAPDAKPLALEDFPEVELVEEEDAAPPPNAGATPGKRLPPRKADPDDDVAARDDEDDEGAPVRKADRKKKKKGKPANMAVRNRIMGAVGAAAGLGLVAFGIMNQEILDVTAHAKAFNPSLEPVPRIATIGFGALLVLVGGYYLIIDMVRGE
jgi:hypothetical protein